MTSINFKSPELWACAVRVVLHCQSLHPYLGIHFKNCNLVTRSTEQRSMRSLSLVGKQLKNAWVTDDGHKLSLLLVKSSISLSFSWLLTLRQPLAATGKQQRSCWLSDPVCFEFSCTYRDGFSQWYAVVIRSSSCTEPWKAIQVFPVPLPRQEQLCYSKSIRLWMDLQGWPLFPSKFEPSFSSLAIYD